MESQAHWPDWLQNMLKLKRQIDPETSTFPGAITIFLLPSSITILLLPASYYPQLQAGLTGNGQQTLQSRLAQNPSIKQFTFLLEQKEKSLIDDSTWSPNDMAWI